VGFTLQSFSPSQSRTPFGARSLPAVSDIAFSCSEDQEITMPRGFKVLLPARIRTPFRPGGRSEADTLLGFSHRTGGLRTPWIRFPGAFPRATVRPLSKRRNERRCRALPSGRMSLPPRGEGQPDRGMVTLDPALGFSREPWLQPDGSGRTGASLRHRSRRSRKTDRTRPPKKTPATTRQSTRSGGLHP
jgi:hypothetical protein